MKAKRYLWKTIIGSFMVITPAIALTSCGSSTSTTKSFAELVVSDDTSVLKDKAFNENTYSGWQRFMVSSEVNNEGANPNKYTKEVFNMPDINSNSKDLDLAKGYWRRPGGTRENTFRQIFNGGANLIIAPGFNHKEAVEIVANQNKDKGFILLDSNVDTKKGNFTNVASFTFRAEQSGFLAGIATAEFLNANKEIFKTGQDDDGKLKVGGFVGLAFPSTVDFLVGFQSGIIAYNLSVENSKNTTNKKEKVEWVSLGPNISDYSSGSFGTGQGDIKSKQLLITEKVDAIIPIAGPQTYDAISVITGHLNRPAIVIGVDSEQENNSQLQKELTDKQLNNMTLKDSNGNPLGNKNIIQFSAIKKLDEAVYKTLIAIFNEKDPNNANYKNTVNLFSNDSGNDKNPIQGFGYNNIGTLSNGTVGISKAGLEWIKLFNQSWVNQDNSLNLSELYKNEAYVKLETSGLLYNDNLYKLTNINELIDNKAVNAIGLIDSTNRVVSELKNNNPPATLNKNTDSQSLNGSIWSLEKGKVKNSNTELQELKKYSI